MRYTLLKHENYGDFHIDFLLDVGAERLLTMQILSQQIIQTNTLIEKFTDFLLSQSVANDSFYVNATRIFDHRKNYLDFEGMIDGDRGNVTQLDTGDWEIVDVSNDRINLKTDSTKHDQLSHRWQLVFPKVIKTVDFSLKNLINILPAPSEAAWQVGIS